MSEIRAEANGGLKVAIGFPSSVMLVIGGVVGVGIFVNPAVVARAVHSPELALAAWAAGGVVALLGAIIYAELAAHIPSTGGEYQYLRAAYGPMAGFLFGWTTLFVVHTGGMAAVAIVFAKNVSVLSGDAIPEPLVVVLTLALLASANCLGVRTGDWTQAVLGAIKVVAILALVWAGFAVTPQALTLHQPSPVSAGGLGTVKGFGAALVPVLFSYGGWQTANYVAGEVKNSARALGRALVVGVVGVIAIYLAVNVACLRVLGVDGLAATLTPTADVLGRLAAPLGARLAAGAVALSALAFLSQSTLTGPRVIYAMARDGLFFRGFGTVSTTARAPSAAIALCAAWACVLALSGAYDRILSYVVAMNFLFFGLSASCLFVLRRRGEASFRAPFHPWITLAFIAASVVVVANAFWSFPLDSLIGYAILAAGVPPYLYFVRKRSAQSPRAADGPTRQTGRQAPENGSGTGDAED